MSDYREGMPTSQLDVVSIVKNSDTLVGNQDGKTRNFTVADVRGINDNKVSEDTTYSSKQINKIISDLSSLSNEDLTVVVNAIGDLTTLLNSKADAEHTHTISQITDMPTSMKNPESLKLKVNGTIQAEYNGEKSKELNITPGSIGAAESNHTHKENIYFVSGIKDESNNYNVILDNITDYYEGLTLCIKVDVNSSGESTLKINELDSIPLLDSEGNPLEADTLKAGIPYHVCYCGTNFIVLGKGGDKGIDTSDATVTSEDILINKSAYGPNGKIEGAMPDNSGINKVLALNETYNIPKGYQDGSSKVTQSITNNGALNGSIGVNGTFDIPAGYTSGGKITQSIVTQGAYTGAVSAVGYNPMYLRIPQGAYFTNTSAGYPEITIPRDWLISCLGIDANKIISGQSIADVLGTVSLESLGGVQSAQGNAQVQYSGTYVNCGFQPNFIVLLVTPGNSSMLNNVTTFTQYAGIAIYAFGSICRSGGSGFTTIQFETSSSGFTVKGILNNYYIRHIAVKLNNYNNI